MDSKIEPTTSARHPSEEISKNNNDYDVGEVHELGGKVRQHDLAKEDVAAELAEMFQGGQGYTKKEVWRLRWKLDLRLVPILWFNVLLPAMDKVSHATAALYGLKTDLDLVGNQYAWIGSVFYVRLFHSCPL